MLFPGDDLGAVLAEAWEVLLAKRLSPSIGGPGRANLLRSGQRGRAIDGLAQRQLGRAPLAVVGDRLMAQRSRGGVAIVVATTMNTAAA